MNEVEPHDSRRDLLAALLSIVPGLGHIYKNDWTWGLGLMFFGAPMALWAGLLLTPATLGLGLLIPLGYIGFVIVHAYTLEDHSHHKLVHAWDNLKKRFR